MNSIRSVFKAGYGPSSSHTIGPARAAEIFAKRNPYSTKFQVTLFGSLAATGIGHGTDVSIKKSFHPAEVSVILKEDAVLPLHPNGMIFEAFDSSGNISGSWEVYSIGGGDLRDSSGLVEAAQGCYHHNTMSLMMNEVKRDGLTLWEYIERCEGKEIWDYLANVWSVMERSIKSGLNDEGVLPGMIRLQKKAGLYHARSKQASGVTKDMGILFSFALAVSEQNASGGLVVTAPTCGSAGVLPAVLAFLKKKDKLPQIKILRGLAVAGLIGALIKENASISGAEVGCQGEIGSGCAMAAAAATQIMGGTPAQIEYAAEMGLEHNLGLTCDPVLGYVQIPCIERNAIAAGKAIECAIYALFSDGGHKINLDAIIETMNVTGRDLQSAYRETGKGGIARIWTDFNSQIDK